METEASRIVDSPTGTMERVFTEEASIPIACALCNPAGCKWFCGITELLYQLLLV
jgi:hypothetical protein